MSKLEAALSVIFLVAISPFLGMVTHALVAIALNVVLFPVEWVASLAIRHFPQWRFPQRVVAVLDPPDESDEGGGAGIFAVIFIEGLLVSMIGGAWHVMSNDLRSAGITTAIITAVVFGLSYYRWMRTGWPPGLGMPFITIIVTLTAMVAAVTQVLVMLLMGH